MSPRAYDRSGRSAALARTRERITRATFALHAEKGILGTSYADIARKADVSIPTVYAHFPSLENLVEACGAHIVRSFPPPGPDVLEGRRSRAARLDALVDAMFDFYDRIGGSFRAEAEESAALPSVRAFHAKRRLALRNLLAEALAPAPADPEAGRLLEVAVVLLDHPSWRALTAALGPGGARKAARAALEAFFAPARRRRGARGTVNVPPGTKGAARDHQP